MKRPIYLIATTLLLLLALLPTDASAQSNKKRIDEQRKYVDKLKKEINSTTKRIDAISSEKGAAYKQVEELESQIYLRNTVINEVEREIELVRQDSMDLAQSIIEMDRAYKRSREQYAEMVRMAYRMGKRNTFATYLFSSTSLEDLSRRMSYVERFADRYKEVANTAKQQQRELVAMQHSMNIRQQELDSIRASLKGEQQALQVDKRQAQSALNKLSQQERDELKKKKRQEEEYKKANAQLEKILAENTEGSNFSSNTRGLKLPIENGRIRPLQKNMAEISGPRGATVRCVEAGTVGEISEASGGHYIIKVAHGKDFYTVYTHVTNVCVKVGQKVKENQQIGTAGLFVDYDGTTRAFIQFMVYNHRTGKMEEVMKFFSPK